MMRIAHQHRRQALVGLLTLCLLGVTGWSHGRLGHARTAATAAAADLAACQQLGSSIRRLAGPAQADANRPHLNELARQIEHATREAQINPDSLISISHDPANRVGDTPYERKSTHVLFRQVTLRQMVTFMRTVTAQSNGPRATRIRLFAPDEQDTQDQWTSEATLTYLIWSPRIRAAQR